MAREHWRPVRLSSWPAILGIGAVTLLIVGMIGLDVLFSQRQAATTANIVENVQRSMLLLSDMRATARRMAETSDPAEFVRGRATIADLAAAYDPLATFTGEREEWTHLQRLLTELSTPRTTTRPVAQIADEIDKSVGDLVSIATAEGNSNLMSIGAAHRQALWSDIAVGAGVLTIVALISVWLLRVLARQRRLVDEHVHVLSERNSELEAFAARAAHDLRSPLNPIRGYAAPWIAWRVSWTTCWLCPARGDRPRASRRRPWSLGMWSKTSVPSFMTSQSQPKSRPAVLRALTVCSGRFCATSSGMPSNFAAAPAPCALASNRRKPEIASRSQSKTTAWEWRRRVRSTRS